MVWEALTAVGTVFTGLVILVTVLLGARQLRATTRQLEQLQRATQLDGTMRIFEVIRNPRFREAQRFVFADLAERLQDEQFRRDAERVGGVSVEIHKERLLLETFEEVGTYVKHGLLSGDAIYDLIGPVIIGSWKRLRDLIAAQRRVYGGNELWENYEFLYDQAKRYDEEHHPEEGAN